MSRRVKTPGGDLRSLLASRRRIAVLAAAAFVILLVASGMLLTHPFWKPGAAFATDTPASAEDRTADLVTLTTEGELDPVKVEEAFAPVRHRLEGLHVLMVPSFLSDFLMPAREVGLADYFQAQERWLAEEGVTFEIAGSNTAASSEENAEWIRRHVEASEKPVCLITHSKGGIDVLVFLAGAEEKLRHKVRCWIALQPPFGGSPIADTVLADPGASALSEASLVFLGGSLKAVADLSTPKRRAFLEEQDSAIKEVTAGIPVLAVAGRFKSDTWLDAGFPYTIPRSWLERRGVESDGLVPVQSARLPHAPFVLLDDADHGATVREAMPLAEDSGLFLKALFTLLPWKTLAPDD